MMKNNLLLQELLETLFLKPGMVVLRNPEGTVELKGDDLTMKEHGDWISIYHSTAANSESRSHLHLRKNSYHYACVRETEGYTAQMTFWKSKEEMSETKPPFAVYFPAFYDWTDGKKEIAEHKKYFEKWLTEHGSEFYLK